MFCRCWSSWRRWDCVSFQVPATSSSLLVRNTLAVARLRTAPESEQPGPSKRVLLVDKKRTGNVPIQSTLGCLEDNLHWRSRRWQVGFELLRENSGRRTFPFLWGPMMAPHRYLLAGPLVGFDFLRRNFSLRTFLWGPMLAACISLQAALQQSFWGETLVFVLLFEVRCWLLIYF